jgi:hypothetical protein
VQDMEVLVPHLFAIVLTGLLAHASPDIVKVLLPLTPAEAHALLTSPERHVRALDPRLDELLAEGVYRSATLGYLLAAIEKTDVIVQVVRSSTLPLSTPARLLLVPQPRTARFVRIEMRIEGTDDDLIALLGHELRHALEIGEAPEVRDDRALAALYRRIGHRDGGYGYDSQSALDTGKQIRRELYTVTTQALR